MDLYIKEASSWILAMAFKSIFGQKKNGSEEQAQELSVNKLDKVKKWIKSFFIRKQKTGSAGQEQEQNLDKVKRSTEDRKYKAMSERFWYCKVFIVATSITVGLILAVGGYAFVIFYFVAAYFMYELITRNRKVKSCYVESQ